VTLLSSRHLSSDQLRQAGTVLARRLTDAKIRFGHVTAVTGHGEQELTLTAPQRSLSAIAAIAHTRGVLQFRRAMSVTYRPPGGSSELRPPRRVSESSTLSAGLMRSYHRLDCRRDPNPNHGDAVANDFVIACSTGGSQKYLLAPTAVDGSEVVTASANLDAASGSQWVVDLEFSKKGAGAWTRVTDKAASVNRARPPTTACGPPKGCNTVAIMLDGVVQSAPYISQPGGITGGAAQISGDFTRKSATQLAAILKGGALPAVFTAAN
jgi:preprotein translocase subunit SecD